MTSPYTVINHGERGASGMDVWWKIEIDFLFLIVVMASKDL
jgi:hypothetical protein